MIFLGAFYFKMTTYISKNATTQELVVATQTKRKVSRVSIDGKPITALLNGSGIILSKYNIERLSHSRLEVT